MKLDLDFNRFFIVTVEDNTRARYKGLLLEKIDLVLKNEPNVVLKHL